MQSSHIINMKFNISKKKKKDNKILQNITNYIY